LTEVWETVKGDFFHSVFSEWTSRLEWAIEHEGEYYINPRWLNRNRTYSFPDQQAVIIFVIPDTIGCSETNSYGRTERK
jgi:hypothetical protein